MTGEVKKHECPRMKEVFGSDSTFQWSLENRGDGWYMYNQKGNRSEKPYNYCPFCGTKLEELVFPKRKTLGDIKAEEYNERNRILAEERREDGKPTEEQVREFWEECGLDEEAQRRLYGLSGINVNSVTLDNIFKFAVPRLRAHSEIKIIVPPQYSERYIAFAGWQRAEAATPALALFWAIWKIIK